VLRARRRVAFGRHETCALLAKLFSALNASPGITSIMKIDFGDYELDRDLARVQFGRVHAWLTETYWSPGITLERVIRAAEHSSFVVGAYFGGEQVGYMRVVSDRTTFGWICDVFVEQSHRGKGLAKAMVHYALDHPDHQDMRRWLLATKDAHPIYSQCGFKLLPQPERWMVKLP